MPSSDESTGALAPAGPRLAFGVPVRNAERHLRRLLDSLSAQDFDDFEVVISDNASTDGTVAICEHYAARDPRFRLLRQTSDIGQIENFNAVLAGARGELFRWIGADDWLEPDYARRCIETLDARPDAIAVSTDFDFVDDRGKHTFRELTGTRLDLPTPTERFVHLMWALQADALYLDPIYTMIRRDALAKTRRLLIVPRTDYVLSAELALLGPFAHVPRCLAHRRRDHRDYTDKEGINRRYHPERHRELRDTPRAIVTQLLGVLSLFPLSTSDRMRCRLAALHRVWWTYSYRSVRNNLRGSAGKFVRRFLPRRDDR